MLRIPVNKGCVDIDEEATVGSSGLYVPCMIVIYKHVYMYGFAQGLWGIWWNGFYDIAIEFLPIHYWELFIINVWIS